MSADPRAASFGAVAEDYERGRPGWPPRVVEVAGLGPDAEVVDLAAGTGKLTRLLLERFARVVAVEPDEALRALNPARERLAGRAESIPLADASVDGVFVAEAFHWFDAAAAVAEIARILRPGGSLVVCFNEPCGEPEPPWPEAAREIVRRHRPPGRSLGGRPLVESGAWRAPFPDAPFGELRYEEVVHELVQSRDEAIAAVLPISGFALLPAETREAMRTELRAAVPDATRRGPLRCEIWWTRRD